MTDRFLILLQMSLMAAAVALLALPLRWLFRRLRLPAGACVALWAVVLLRMVLPVGLFTSPVSLMGWLTPAVAERVDALAREERPEAPAVQLTPSAPAGEAASPAPAAQSSAPAVPVPETVSPPETAPGPEAGPSGLDVLAWVWGAGVLAVWGYTLFSWLRLRRILSTAVRRKDKEGGQWWESDRISTAFVFGLLHPRVYVPAGLEGERLGWVRLHEQAHIRLGHHWLKPLWFLALGLHWFNPALWLAWALFCRDLELHCDEQVLSAAGGGRKAYSAALLTLAAPRRGPLLPPGFGETGVKDRIQRALRWKRPARWIVAVAAVLCILLVWTLAADPTSPGDGPDIQYPTLRIHLEEDGPGGTGGETVVDMGTPEEAVWPAALPETVRTAPTPSPWVDLYLDNGEFPDQWSLTEYLVEDGEAVHPQAVELSPYGAETGFLLRAEPREDAPGTGMETRLYVLSCTWRRGLSQSHTLEYAFQLTLPSVPPGPLTEPVVVAGDQRVDLLAWGASATAAMGEMLRITLPDEVTAYTLEGGEAGYAARRTLSQGDGGGSFSIRIGYLDTVVSGTYSDQTQTYTLTCTWAGGSQMYYPFTLYAYTLPPEWDDENLRIRFPGDTEWTDLDTLIPVPAEWANQDLAGRDQATDLVGILDGTGGMLDGLNGWFVFTIGRGVANADTYVYRTHDGGHTWTETGRPDPSQVHWYPSCARFVSDEVGYIGFRLFEDAPVFRTTDGGETWERLDLPLPEGTWECTEIEDTYRLHFTSPEGDTCTAYSYDGGNIWYVVRPIGDPEAIPLEELPWPSREQLGYFQPDYSIWEDGPVKMLGFSDDRTAAVFCFDEGMTGQNGLLLCVGGRLAYFPELTYQVTPQVHPANPVWGDFDGDGTDELAVIPTPGTGTGVFMQDLYVFEWDGQSITLGGTIDAYEMWDLDLGLPAGRRIGSQVRFWTEGDTILADIGVEDSAAPHTTDYVGALTGPVTYDSRGLTLDPAALTYTEDTSF